MAETIQSFYMRKNSIPERIRKELLLSCHVSTGSPSCILRPAQNTYSRYYWYMQILSTRWPHLYDSENEILQITMCVRRKPARNTQNDKTFAFDAFSD